MAETISIDLEDHQLLYLEALRILQDVGEINTLMRQVGELMNGLSDQGYYHERMSPESDEGVGIPRYITLADNLSTLTTVFAGHIQRSRENFVDMDKALAVYLTELALNDSGTDAEVKEYIRENPEEAVSFYQDAIKEQQEQ